MDPTTVSPIAQIFGGVAVSTYFIYHLTSKWRESRNGGSSDVHVLKEIKTEIAGLRQDLTRSVEQSGEAHRRSGEALAALLDRK